MKQWITQNQSELSDQYSDMLSHLEDSSEHIRYMANSDKCFQEWCEEQYELQAAKTLTLSIPVQVEVSDETGWHMIESIEAEGSTLEQLISNAAVVYSDQDGDEKIGGLEIFGQKHEEDFIASITERFNDHKGLNNLL